MNDNTSVNILIESFEKLVINEPLTEPLMNIKKYLEITLTTEILQELSSYLYSLQKSNKGDGAGLISGTLIDLFLCQYLSKKIPNFVENHKGESDCYINNFPFSIKKINGKSTIALNWSKNPNNSKTCDLFTTDIMIINICTQRWWSNKPLKPKYKNILYNRIIPSGIYLIDKNYCKSNIILESNNKTNTLIDAQNLYYILINCLDRKLCIELPINNKNLVFNILKAFE